MQKKLPPTTLDALSPPAKNYTFFENVSDHPFRPDDAAVNLRSAWWLMDAAMLAYSSPTDVEQAFSTVGLGATVKWFSGKATTQAYVAASPDWIVLAFRGTQLDDFLSSVIDWSVDALFFPAVDAHLNLVHAGFLTAIKEVWNDIVTHISGLQAAQARPLWITGHSLGAALATLAANLCSDQPNNLGLKGLYTYGSPRVGDQPFGRRIPCKVRRFRNNSDIVTHVPIGIVFRHVGELEFIDAAGHAHLGLGSSEKLFLESTTLHLSTNEAHTMSRMMHMAGAKAPLPGFIADHAPINYAIRMWNCYDAAVQST